MRIEFIFLIVVSAICYHIYTDGKWTTQFMTYKKQLQIGGVILVALILYWLFKKDPMRAHKLILSGNEYVKYLPIDPATSSVISPIIDFTSKWSSPSFSNNPPNGINGGGGRQQASITKIMNSGTTNNKRSVSESKKKFVASQQDWTCHNCREKLKATFEVDHIVPLFKGGTNHIDNLRALCLECHRLHTISDKL
jgi:HNH endonuclease